jgi:hypothetical protein
MKRLLILLLLLATPALADESVFGYFTVRYDLDATSITYCRSEGQRGDPFAPNKPNDYLVDNAGSETAVTSATAGEDVFLGMAAGDVIFITVDQVVYPRGIVTYTDTENIVVDEAIDLSGSDYPITWRRNNCGTAVTDGWLDIGNQNDVTITFFLKQYVGDGNGLDIRVEGTVESPDGTTNLVQLWPTGKTVGGAATVQNFTTAGIATNIMINVPEPVQKVRIGMLHNTADDGGDLTTNAEQITGIVHGRVHR